MRTHAPSAGSVSASISKLTLCEQQLADYFSELVASHSWSTSSSTCTGKARLAIMESEAATVERLATTNELPDAVVSDAGRLEIAPLNNAVPEETDALIQQANGLLPHLKITELLLEVDGWTDFTPHFTHLKIGDTAEDRHLLLSTILADSINLGLTKIAESHPGTTHAKRTWLQASWSARASITRLSTRWSLRCRYHGREHCSNMQAACIASMPPTGMYGAEGTSTPRVALILIKAGLRHFPRSLRHCLKPKVT